MQLLVSLLCKSSHIKAMLHMTRMCGRHLFKFELIESILEINWLSFINSLPYMELTVISTQVNSQHGCPCTDGSEGTHCETGNYFDLSEYKSVSHNVSYTRYLKFCPTDWNFPFKPNQKSMSVHQLLAKMEHSCLLWRFIFAIPIISSFWND